MVLNQSEFITERERKIFVVESSGSAILDCGAAATVAGKNWFASYCDGLTKDDEDKIVCYDSNWDFKFRSEDKYKSLY